MLTELARTTLKLLQFRAGPQDFPFSLQATRTVVMVAVAVSYFQYRLTLPPLPALVHALVSLGVMAALTWQLLNWRRVGNRAQQTINSLFATGSALTILLLPLLTAVAPQIIKMAETPDTATTEALPPLPMLGLLALSLWSLAVSANIYRHALNLPLMMGLLASLFTALVSVSVAGTISGLLID